MARARQSGRTEGGANERGGDVFHVLRLIAVAFLFLTALVGAPSHALAHASERGYVLLLPTGYYILGGAAAVAASFAVLALLPGRLLEKLARQRLQLGHVGTGGRLWTSLAAFAILAALVAAGFSGSRDPLSNPLPLVVWTLLWTGLTLVQGAFGNLWAWINPWYGPWRLVATFGGPGSAARRLPQWCGYWPALAQFLGFAWFELVYPAPSDPAILGWVAATYWLGNFLAMLAFGFDDWSRRGELFSVFFRMVSRFAVIEAAGEEDGRQRIALCWPGAKLWAERALPPGGMLFLLLALSSVSFDGLSKTFFWLGLNGVNPLEFPGRSALVGANTDGLVATFAALAAAYLLAVLAGERLAGGRGFREAAGLLVWSIVPIALAYHFAHYLTDLLVNGQYALVALSDPFSLGWNLFGTAYLQVGVGLVLGSESAWWLWNAQAGAIISGHVLAVLVAHALAFRLHPLRATASQLPLTVLMVGYTMFGLWLLSTPTAG